MNKKNNQRFQETEQRMEHVMLELMRTADFEKITVKRICEKAGVNRSTFYAHFMDIYDMLDRMETNLRRELMDGYSKRDKSQRRAFSRQSFLVFLQHIRRHRHFYKISLQTRKSFPIEQGFEPLWNEIIKPRCEQCGVTSEAEMMYYFVYFQAGFTMVLKRWVDSGCLETEAEVARIIESCVPAVLVSPPDQRMTRSTNTPSSASKE